MNQIRRLHAAITAAILGAALTIVGAAPVSAATIDVRPGGSVQAAVDQAGEGGTVRLAPGEYRERVTITTPGVTIEGHGAWLVSGGHAIDIDAPNVTIRGLTIYGQPNIDPATFPTDPTLEQARAWKDSVQSQVVDGRGIYIGKDAVGVSGTRIEAVNVIGAGGECIRMRSNAIGNTVTRSNVLWCGMLAKGDKGGGDSGKDAYHNGEGVYIGTSPKSDDQPMPGTDASTGNKVTDSYIATYGSECFNVKETAHANEFVNNRCEGNIEPATHNGSLVELRGSNNLLAGNLYGATAGAVVKVKADDGFTAAGNRVDDGAPAPVEAAESVPAEPAPASDAPSSPPATSGNRSGLPFLSGVFAHDLPRIERYEQATGHPVDLWQIAPQREQGDDTMVSETQRTLAEVPAGVAVDYAFPIEGAGMGAGMGARLGSVLAAKTDAPVYVRPGWEFNLQGSWAWTTDRIGDAAFVAGFRATVDGLRSTCPQCIIVWNPNTGQGGIDKAMQAWPGDAYVQVVGVDAYDWGNEDPMDGPGQLNEWAAKARELGKQISLPEWGVHGKDGRGDNPAFVNDVLAWADRNRDIVAYLSYFDEPADYIVNSVGDGQMPKTGEALRAGFERLASSPGSVSAQPATAAPQPAPAQAPDAASTGGVSDVRDQEWTDPAGSSSTYHLLNLDGARGLVVYLDGDGSYGYDNPGDGYALGGPEGVAAKAAAKGYATLAVRPVGGAETFWGDGPRNAAYVAALTEHVTAQGGFSDVAVIGYSGGSQLATKWLLPQHPDLASLVVVTGGGGAPDQVPSPVTGTRLVWHTGADDDGRGTSDDYNAIGDARAGAAAYRAAGWDVTESHPAGQAHDLGGQFGSILAAHLGEAVSVPTDTTPVEQSWPAPTQPTPPAPAPEQPEQSGGWWLFPVLPDLPDPPRGWFGPAA